MVDLTKARTELLVAWSSANLKEPELAAGLFKLIADLDTLTKIPTPEQKKAEWEAECLRLLNSNQLINAIKLYRSKTGCDLREAQYAVERMK
jgi:ribosomal protein L7/L12